MIVSKVINSSPIVFKAQAPAGKPPAATRWTARERAAYKNALMKSPEYAERLMRRVLQKLARSRP